MITLREIWKGFGAVSVLRGVNLEARDGETLVVLGRSGCGKSVLLKMIVGLLKPDGGSILVDGNDVPAMSYPQLRELRFDFGVLFQGAALFDSLSVGENIALALQRKTKGDRRATREKMHDALELVGLGSIEKMMPAALSGGMRKRVGLARAIAPRPRYLLYDEPTTGLDLESADGISLLINSLRTTLGITSIVVTHDIHSAFVVGNRFAILEGGVALTTGTKEELEQSSNEDVRKYISTSLSSLRTPEI
jgi:phospholipid/cholesterol/gamma-HCH transport system ATP-binding protein